VVASYEPSVPPSCRSCCRRHAPHLPVRGRGKRRDLGAAKNVIAIAAGSWTGSSWPEHAGGAPHARAAEIRRLGTKLGGSPDVLGPRTGDLILTATGNLSRNRRVGLALAKGATLAEALASLGGEVAEGVATTPAILEVARDAGVEMPIAEMVGRILSGSVAPREAVRALMTRGLKEEKG
jgi:glycerol-3-phosphate dehydrogenase (NAD(P)+)